MPPVATDEGTWEYPGPLVLLATPVTESGARLIRVPATGRGTVLSATRGPERARWPTDQEQEGRASLAPATPGAVHKSGTTDLQVWEHPGRGAEMHVNAGEVRRASTGVRASVEGTAVRQASSAVRAGADAVRGGELEAALREVAPQLERRLIAFTDACSQWSFDLEASVAAYEETDAASGEALRGLAWRSV